MLTISKMKSLIITPTTAAAVMSPMSKSTTPPFASLFFLSHSKPTTTIITNSSLLQNPILSLPIKPTILPLNNIKRRSFNSKAGSDSQQPPSGEIHVIVGPMFAGKTTTLLRRVQAERDSGRNVAVIKSDKDTRYGLDSIVSHDGAKLPCWALPNLSSFKQKFGANAYDKLDVIGIDEAQFFEDLYDFCREAADHDGKTIIVAGLDGDYLRRSFGRVLDTIPLADSVTKLSARCEVCGKRAFFTLRKTEETKKELIGGGDIYKPVCRQHYVSGQVVAEATKIVRESQKVHCDSLI